MTKNLHREILVGVEKQCCPTVHDSVGACKVLCFSHCVAANAAKPPLAVIQWLS